VTNVTNVMKEPAKGPWHDAAPELVIAAVAVIATAAAGYVMASWMGLAVVAIVAAAIALLVLRNLLPRSVADAEKKARERRTARPISGYSRRRFLVSNGIANRAFYDLELRPVLEHLLAARLAERHGVNLYQDPATARRLLCRGRRDAALWGWIAPGTLTTQDQGRRGIPRYVLARLIDRLEKL
jgi:hypothetical protein